MTLSLRPLIAWSMALLTMTFAASAQEQSVPADSQGQRAQTLRSLSLWEKVKLGAAYYTDPHLVQKTQLNYGYDPKTFNDQKIADFEKQGVLYCASQKHSEAGTFNVVQCDKVSPSVPWLVVSDKPDLLGKTPEVALVKAGN
jgi:hypothetical protein